MSYVILLLGLGLLIKGADFFVDGASSISKEFNMPPLLIGLTIVAFGTSAPEAAVSITASLKGANEIVVGNVVGSNIFNLLMAIGVAAAIRPMMVQKNTISKEFPLAIYASLVLLFTSLDLVTGGGGPNQISRSDGFILLLGFFVFLFYLVQFAILSKEADQSIVEIPALPLSRSIIFLILGLGMILGGGNLVVDSATVIALSLGMSQTLVALTIVAVGTSLPELVTSAVAAWKGEADIAVGNIIGSNLFNVFFILGISALVKPVIVVDKITADIVFLLAVTILTYFFAYTGKVISKKEGWFLTALYVGYMIFIIIRN